MKLKCNCWANYEYNTFVDMHSFTSMDLKKMWGGTSWENWNENVMLDPWSYPEGQGKEWWHRRITGVACITDKVREARLRWYGHIQRREEDDCVKWILKADVHGQRSWGRQRKRWTDAVKYNMEDLWLTVEDTGIVLNGEGEPMWQRDS